MGTLGYKGQIVLVVLSRIYGHQTLLICIWFPLDSPVLTLVLVKRLRVLQAGVAGHYRPSISPSLEEASVGFGSRFGDVTPTTLLANGCNRTVADLDDLSSRNLSHDAVHRGAEEIGQWLFLDY